ncbi:glycosyltransferase [Luteimicrobium subarcticum]|uniref:Glycosyltransferase involved in cell wall biosynthesis n=1 Tax=Luteimicrobium subarcticum TaxID=620910 RepID=A0A2M8WWM5_9MICO|nr:glycosyltransferase [Luteimicrobium subarcticum]PJI95286.1 glycosyltransferase involved in cell wall biosynthesis [Luteimicrobium subarcticum]
MRVVQVLGSSAGGVARHVGQVADVLVERGTSVRVAGPASVAPTVRAAAGAAGAALDVVDVEIADRPRGSDVGALRRLRALARDADVVHAHGLRAGALSVLGAVGLRARRPRVVVTLHNLPVGGRGVRTVSAVLERVVARGADVVLGVSPDLVDLARVRGARDVALALVPAPAVGERPGRSAAQVRDALGVRADQGLVVTVARLAPQKGLDVLLDAASRCAMPLVWAVAGDGPLRADLAAQVTARDLPVRLLGARDDVPDLLAAADVVVSTARWEGQPLWLQEALGAGAAVVATDVGGTAAVTGDAAVLVPTGPPGTCAEALAAAVGTLLADPDERAARAAASLRRAAALPRRADLADQLDAVYRGSHA